MSGPTVIISDSHRGGPVLDSGCVPNPGRHFVGREAELARLDKAWKDSVVPVLTLVAFGGVGKSALVLLDGPHGGRRLARCRVDTHWSFYS